MEQNFKKFIHPLEQEAKEALLACFGSESIVEKIYEYYQAYGADGEQLGTLANGVRINESSFPKLQLSLNKLCQDLGMEQVPAYLLAGKGIEIEAKGFDQHWLEIGTDALHFYSEQELDFMLARQLAHIKLGHMKYRILYQSFLSLIRDVSNLTDALMGKMPLTAGVKDKLSEAYIGAIELAGARWCRISEYSADAYALGLCSWKIKVAARAIVKQVLQDKVLAEQVDIKNYLKQADDLTAAGSAAYANSVNTDLQPSGALRLKELLSLNARI